MRRAERPSIRGLSSSTLQAIHHQQARDVHVCLRGPFDRPSNREGMPRQFNKLVDVVARNPLREVVIRIMRGFLMLTKYSCEESELFLE